MALGIYTYMYIYTTFGIRKYRKISLKPYFMDNDSINVVKSSQGRHAAGFTLGHF